MNQASLKLRLAGQDVSACSRSAGQAERITPLRGKIDGGRDGRKSLCVPVCLAGGDGVCPAASGRRTRHENPDNPVDPVKLFFLSKGIEREAGRVSGKDARFRDMIRRGSKEQNWRNDLPPRALAFLLIVSPDQQKIQKPLSVLRALYGESISDCSLKIKAFFYRQNHQNDGREGLRLGFRTRRKVSSFRQV